MGYFKSNLGRLVGDRDPYSYIHWMGYRLYLARAIQSGGLLTRTQSLIL